MKTCDLNSFLFEFGNLIDKKIVLNIIMQTFKYNSTLLSTTPILRFFDLKLSIGYISNKPDEIFD